MNERERQPIDARSATFQDDGVRVYVLVFKEMSFAMGLNSLHTKRALIGKSKKGFIKVREGGERRESRWTCACVGDSTSGSLSERRRVPLVAP